MNSPIKKTFPFSKTTDDSQKETRKLLTPSKIPEKRTFFTLINGQLQECSFDYSNDFVCIKLPYFTKLRGLPN